MSSRARGEPSTEATSFVGRAGDLEALDALFASARLVTVLGPGGVGKTRLAARWARGLPEERGELIVCDLTDARTALDVCSAVARTDAAIECLPRARAAQLMELDPDINARDGAETQREFTHRRETVIASASQALPQRLAAFLLLLARFNADEGRDPSIVHDEMTGPVPVVCTYLATDADALGSALKQLSDLGAIELLPPRGVRICDFDFLAYIAGCREPASHAGRSRPV